MSSGGWGIPPTLAFPSPSAGNYVASTPPGRYNCQFIQRNSYRDNWSGVSDDVYQEYKVSPEKYEYIESRKYIVNSPRMNITNRNSSEIKPISPRKPKPKMIKSSDNSPSAKVKMEIYLERFKTGVFLTKVKVGTRVKWQDVKYEKQALRYHSAIKRFQTVMSAIDIMKNYKTLHISLTKDEAARYKAGDFLEGVSKPKPQSKPGISCKQINNYYNVNNCVYNAGPSTSTGCIEDDNYECSGPCSCSSDYSTD